VEFLVRLDIDSISLNPDCVVRTTRHVLEIEKHLRLAATPPSAESGNGPPARRSEQPLAQAAE
jgi:pyruvate,water dikinase